MEINTLLTFLILFGIFLQGSDSQSEEHIYKSSDGHIRKKRVIDTSHDRNETFLHQEVPYVVRILFVNHDVCCTGIILKPRIILTAAHCANNQISSIATGPRRNENTQIHEVESKFVHEQYNATLKINDIALLLINNSIDLIHSFHRPIELYEGRLPPNTHGLVTGWGCTSREETESVLQPSSILVPIISLHQCQQAYNNIAVIRSRDICTLSVNRKKCCSHGDSGAPLVVSGRLVGVFSCFHPSTESQFPDVFVNMLYANYRRWIKNKVDIIHSHHEN